MNSIKGFMNGLYKVVGPAVNVLFALFLTIAGNSGFQAYKASKNALTASDLVNLALLGDKGAASAATKSSGTGFITFLQVLFWIVAVIYIGCKVLELLNALNENPNALKSLKTAGAPAQNVAQSQFGQPAQSIPQPAAPAVAPAGAERFCTQCGAKVPAGNAFCTGCGAKMD
ncbi:zinc ribbon domain-containing protein [Ruminococcus albus]|uniref:Zinc-ribbon domain-containing protein n=1 Tax=Ruminococcus albus TaxID=1264 RepID=A0A1H7F8G8_RUMAL|nr:zinc ribbon domain-containing protein [Ruminococcus albus]SEK20300.1 zinc-ribbon domain-containing protein [Ruminococcus albus]